MRAWQAVREVAGEIGRAVRAARTGRDRAGLAVLVAFLATAAIATAWVARYGLAIHRLTYGVGDLVFYDADGKPWFRMNEQRRDVPLARISPHLQRAVIAVEDHRFAYHPGIDPIGFARAVVLNLRAGRRTQGGSTLTQQLARTLYLGNERTWGRKGKEALLALMLEIRLTKAQILELYLNRIYLSAGIYGVEVMARSLFGKSAADVTLAEAALIAGLIRAPSALSPWSNLDGARERSLTVLARMVETGAISEAEARAAKRQRLRVRPHPGAADARAGYAKEFLRQRFRDRFGGNHPADWQVHTTILPSVQDAAEKAVADGLRRLNAPGLQAALVALDPRTGAVLAIVGGRDFRTTSFNRAWRSRRQPGSAFKPFVYAAALERGYSPVSVVNGLDTLAPQGIEEWTPRNARGEIVPSMTLREALAESNNRAAVALQQGIGTRPVLRLAADVGLHDQPNVASLALGSGLATPLAMAAAYAVFPNGGWSIEPFAIGRVLDEKGSVALEDRGARTRVLPEDVAFQMVSMMRDVVERGTGTAVRAWGVRFPVGAKSGTTNEFKDAWFVGYSTAVVAAVWVGYDQPAPIGPDAFGSRVALPIWAEFMRRTARTLRPGPFEPPASLRVEELCRETYLRPVEGCPVYPEYFKRDDLAPGRLCGVHRGTLKQRARRALEGALAAVWRRMVEAIRR